MRKRTAAILMAAAMAVGALGGCGNSGNEPSSQSKAGNANTESAGGADEEALSATITVWGPQEDQAEESGKWLQTMCEQFSEEHPNWDLTFEYAVCPESDAKTTITQDPEGAADVYMFANDHLPALIASNAIAKLGGETAEYVKTSNAESVADSVTVDGDIYGVPFTSNTWFMYYDKSAFTEDDIKSLDKMLEKDKVAVPVDNSWNLPAFFFANGCTLFGEESNDEAAGVQFGGENGVTAAKYVLDLVSNPNFINDKDGSAISGMRDGSVKAMFSGTWSYDAIKEILGDDIGIAQPPCITIDGEEKQLKAFAGSKAIGVNPNSKNMQVSVALAKYLGSAEAQEAHYEIRNIIPCNIEALESDKIKDDPLAIAQNDTINNASVLQPLTAKIDNFWKPMENFGASILNGQVTHENVEEMVEVFNESANTSIAE